MLQGIAPVGGLGSPHAQDQHCCCKIAGPVKRMSSLSIPVRPVWLGEQKPNRHWFVMCGCRAHRTASHVSSTPSQHARLACCNMPGWLGFGLGISPRTQKLPQAEFMQTHISTTHAVLPHPRPTYHEVPGPVTSPDPRCPSTKFPNNCTTTNLVKPKFAIHLDINPYPAAPTHSSAERQEKCLGNSAPH